MIAHLKGRILEKDPNRIVLDVSGVGYDVFVPLSTFYGLADAERNRPVDEETIYHWASITKTLTGIAIMQLRDRGLLSLDDPVIKYVPELRAAHNPYGDMSEITIRQLMSHSAGFRNPAHS